MNVLKTAWHDILLCWTFFTRIPAPNFMTERKLSQALWALPLVGIVVAGLQVGIAWVALAWFSPSIMIFAVFMLLVPIVVTGGLHWDGLADVFDGLGVGKARRAEVMRDPNVGAFGLLGLLGSALIFYSVYMVFLTSDAIIVHDITRWYGLPMPFMTVLVFFGFVAVISRLAMGCLWAFLPATDKQSQAERFGQPSKWVMGGLLLTFLFAPFLIGGFFLGYIAIIVIFLAFCAVFALFVHRTFGGVNGDILGASQVLFELTLLILLVPSLNK